MESGPYGRDYHEQMATGVRTVAGVALAIALTWAKVWVIWGGFAIVSVAQARETADLNRQRIEFIEVRKTLARGDEPGFRQAMQALSTYPLHDYLRYEWLVHQISLGRNVDDDIAAFMEEFSGDWLGRQLRLRWLHALAEEKRWEPFIREVNPKDSEKLQCLRLTARHKLGELQGFDSDSWFMWLRGEPHPQSCDEVIPRLEAQAPPGARQVWERFFLAMKKGNISLAEALTTRFNNRDKAWAELWIRVHQDPETGLAEVAHKPDSLLARKIVEHGIRRLADQDARAGRSRWRSLRERYPFSSKEREELDRYVALEAAFQHLPEAASWLGELPAKARTRTSHEWRVRAALRQLDWAETLDAVEAMPQRLGRKREWRYWQARALERLGRQQEAEFIYARLAQNPTYYGFLATDRLGLPYRIESQRLDLSEGYQQSLLNRSAILRAREYLYVGLVLEARREWNKALRGLSREELKAAAVLADRWGWHERAVSTVARTGHRSDYELRFPMPFEAQVREMSSQYDLEPAFIYSVIRKESAYMSDAKSRVGAVGLMQLMPATARTAAQRLSRPLAPGDLSDVDTNIELGSYYLRSVMDEFNDQQSLAAAAYNAGPHRVQRWLPDAHSLPADVWVETIPYRETRGYVQSVLAYTTVFDWRIAGKATPLKLRMAEVAAKNSIAKSDACGGAPQADAGQTSTC